MLVLQRKTNESIIIDGGTIKITIVGINDGRVRVGIEAPRTMSVHREEIHLAILRQLRGGANDDSGDNGTDTEAGA